MTILNKKFPAEGKCNYSLFERISEAQDISKKKKLCIYIYDRPDASTFRYRVYNICQLLEGSEKFGAIYFYSHELEAVFNILKAASLIIFCRTRWSNEYEVLISEVKRLRIPIVYDCDDLVVDISKMPMVCASILADLDAMLLYASKLYLVAKQADFIFSTNQYLLERLTKLVNKPGFVIPNFFNNEQLEHSKKLALTKKDNSIFTIGYFSGSPSHYNDLNVCLEEITQFLNENKDSKLVVAGHIKLPEQYSRFYDQKQIEYLPFTDYLGLQNMISNVDVNIAPLLLNEFTNCKSDLKFFEASIVTTPTVASPTYTFLNSIDHGINGLLSCPGDWFLSMKYLYENPIKRKQIARNAYDKCLEIYGSSKMLAVTEKALSEIMSRSPDKRI